MSITTSIGLILRQLKSLSKYRALEIIAFIHKRKKTTVKEVSEKLNIPLSTARKYLEELVAAKLLEKIVENEQVLYVGRKFVIKLDPETIVRLMEAKKESLTEDIIKEYGTSIITKLRKLGPLVKEGKLSIYDFAAELGLTYIEAYALLEENGYL
ncbi:MAG: helix-turn-helix domain-containing protein [Candidatus Odinarchaeota archaeon]|nr:helix-turn-helix domain-containing protein [Candidatus Odinarchaeota archaeon]